jgi:N-acetylglutamate synthase-like GNAT family acetyltransferase/anti-sigma regulatory factor (Ser/Thr protein kinase)
MSHVKMSVRSDAGATALVAGVIPPFAAAADLSDADAGRLRAVVVALLRFTLEHAYPDDPWGEIEVTLEAGAGVTTIDIHDWGLPITSAGGEAGPLPAPLASLAKDADDVRLINLGGDGKRLTAHVRTAGTAHQAADPPPARPEPVPHSAAADLRDAIQIREAGPDDAEGIARLLYENYHLSYVHPDFYRPRYLAGELTGGRLRSTIAVHEGRVVGHHAIMTAAESASAETGAAVVHSAYRGLGMFGRMFPHTVDRARGLGLAAIYGDAVTMHPFSQRAEHAHGYRASALMLGLIPAAVTMQSIDAGHPERRTAAIRSYLVFDRTRRSVTLPERYNAPLAALYDDLRVEQEPAVVPDDDGDAVTGEDDSVRGLAFLRVRRWRPGAAEAVVHTVRHLLSRHADLLYADVDLHAVGDPGAAVSCLNEHGFFLAGLVLHGPEGHDHLRLQRLNCEHVELEAIVCASPASERLKLQVLADRVRVERSPRSGG